MTSNEYLNNEESGVGLLPRADDLQLESVGPACEKCGAPIDSHGSMVCGNCGWYASIGAYVEIDGDGETETDSQIAGVMGDGDGKTTNVPSWVFVMLACLTVVILGSIAALYLTIPDSPVRTTWAVTQLCAGLVAAAVAHMAAFIVLANSDAEVGLLDVFLRPIRPWVRIACELPQKQWVWHLGVSGVTAAIMSVAVIGSIPYEKLLDWGTKPPPKQNLAGAVMSQMQKVKAKEQSLEEAVQDLAGTQNLDEAVGGLGNQAPRQRETEDCVVLGYRANDEGLAYLLILGGEVHGRLRYVGQVRVELPVGKLRELSQQLAEQHTFRPVIQLEMQDVQWVIPQTACRISYDRRGSSGVLQETKLDMILGQLKLN